MILKSYRGESEDIESFVRKNKISKANIVSINMEYKWNEIFVLWYWGIDSEKIADMVFGK